MNELTFYVKVKTTQFLIFIKHKQYRLKQHLKKYNFNYLFKVLTVIIAKT